MKSEISLNEWGVCMKLKSQLDSYIDSICQIYSELAIDKLTFNKPSFKKLSFNESSSMGNVFMKKNFEEG
jgi:hypothetical protein